MENSRKGTCCNLAFEKVNEAGLKHLAAGLQSFPVGM